MKYKYISSIPKSLLDDLVNNRVIPFIGAGFSKNADIPNGLNMPDWNEIGKLAADEILEYEYNNAIDALSYYEDLYSRTKLVEFLMKKLHFGKIQPGNTYKAFCELFTGTICTTNFDSLIEDEMTLLHRPVSVIVTEDRLTIGNTDESKIIKLHGDFNHPNKMVITENDYDKYIENNPVFATYISNLFITNTMLLVGYSLDDYDLRSIWKVINSRLGNMTQPAYCIVVNADQEKIAKYHRRNVRLINLEGKPKDYKTILENLFAELRDYVDKERDRKVESSDEKINEQMIIPAEDNKLCYISCTMSRISQLSAMLNPILSSYGVTPVRIDDMLMPGDNRIEVSNTAIRKSKAAIVDITDSTPNILLELEYLKSMKPEDNILTICENNKLPNIPELKESSILQYAFNDLSENDFRNFLSEWICKVFDTESITQDNKCNFLTDAKRLFNKGEYSACIVSAYSELEYQLSFDYYKKEYGKNHFILSQYLRYHFENDIKTVNKFVLTRNKIVHQRYEATKKDASVLIEFAKKVFEKFITAE